MRKCEALPRHRLFRPSSVRGEAANIIDPDNGIVESVGLPSQRGAELLDQFSIDRQVPVILQGSFRSFMISFSVAEALIRKAADDNIIHFPPPQCAQAERAAVQHVEFVR
jgi:hypothetical protein